MLPTAAQPRQEHGIIDGTRQTGTARYQQPPLQPVSARARCAVAALLVLITLATTPPLAATPRIETDTSLTTAGYYQLRWTAATTNVDVEVDDPASGSTTIIYSGPDRARVISGQSDGTRQYRVREVDDSGASAWSPALSVTVAHHSLGRAFSFFAVGALVFLATLVLVVRGARSDA